MRSFFLRREESRWIVRLRRFTITTACLYAALSLWGMYRRLIQVQRIELRAPSTTLAPGMTVGIDVITSGEVHNRILLELIQGAVHETLLNRQSETNKINTLDPRLFRYTPSVTLTAATLARFRGGVATLRLTVFGNQKLLRTPRPRVRDLEVVIAPETAPELHRHIAPAVIVVPNEVVLRKE